MIDPNKSNIKKNYQEKLKNSQNKSKQFNKTHLKFTYDNLFKPKLDIHKRIMRQTKNSKEEGKSFFSKREDKNLIPKINLCNPKLKIDTERNKIGPNALNVMSVFTPSEPKKTKLCIGKRQFNLKLNINNSENNHILARSSLSKFSIN